MQQRNELANPSTEEEVMEAMGKFKGGKAGGKVTFLLRCGGAVEEK